MEEVRVDTERRNGPTLAEVAKEAGVSISTASKVLNGRPGIAPGTRASVEAAIARMGYMPSVAPSRSDRHDAARPVVVVFDTLVNIYGQHVLEGVLAAAQPENIPVQVFALGDEASPPDPSDTTWLSAVLKSNPQALIMVTASIEQALLDAVRGFNVPFVAVGPQMVPDGSVVNIGATNWIGGLQATEYLLGLGHTRIGFVGPPGNLLDFQARTGGWRQALENAGFTADPELVTIGSLSFAGGTKAMETLLRLEDPPTAVVAFNDIMAAGAVSGARAAGRVVPEEVSVVGFDDTYARLWPDPSLTTVRLPLREMGETGLLTAVGMARGEKPVSNQVQLATSLVIRGSTGSPPQ